MKAIVVTDQAAGTAGMTLVERPEPPAAINDVVVQVHASGFVPTEMAWPSTWTDRRDRDRTPSIPGHELAGVVTALGYGTTGLSVGQRVFGLAAWHRDGTLADYVPVEARNLGPLPGDPDFTVGASVPNAGLTTQLWLFDHAPRHAAQRGVRRPRGGPTPPMRWAAQRRRLLTVSAFYSPARGAPLGRALCRYRAGGAGLPGAISGPEERSMIETTEKAILASDCFWGCRT